MNKNNKTIFVGVSGGVDSSVSAAILKEQGYNVVGVFIRTWTPNFIECTWQNERRDAMRVCAHLDIPFLECDAEEEYKKGVVDYMIEEYKKGNTPNPDVMCNREVKFGVFWNFAKNHGADYIATGHYASIKKNNHFSQVLGRGRTRSQTSSKNDYSFLLTRSIDDSKDQSYFLWTLTQDDLAHVLFPVGHLKKTEVRKLAEEYGLPTATKKDSQGVCFLGPLDMKDFLKHYIESKKGEVLNEKGEVIGSHYGAVFFTLGERHGFTLNKHSDKDEPLYVISKSINENTITVSTSPRNLFFSASHPPLSEEPDHSKNEFLNKTMSVINTNWISGIPEKNKKYTAQIRYHGELLNCKIFCTSPTGAEITFNKNILVGKGQSIVIYDGDICLGGGVVE